jgi:hypothetical protein
MLWARGCSPRDLWITGLMIGKAPGSSAHRVNTVADGNAQPQQLADHQQ